MPGYRIELLGRLGVGRRDQRVLLTPGASRLTAYLACRREVGRNAAAQALWPELPLSRAQANLRTALWRLQGACPDLITATKHGLQIDVTAGVDLADATDLAHKVIGRVAADLPLAVWLPLTKDVLPDWEDDWITVERERYRQLRLHALELLALGLAGQKRYAEAIDTAIAAVRADPLRETAHRTLITLHLREGNKSEAVRAFREYCRLLDADLGIAPSAHLASLVADAVGGDGDPFPMLDAAMRR